MATNISFDKMLDDLNSIPINKNDILFEVFSSDIKTNTMNSDDNNTTNELNELNIKLEKYVLFKNDTKNLDSLNCLNNEFESLEKRLNSLQHFIDVSKKFFNQ